MRALVEEGELCKFLDLVISVVLVLPSERALRSIGR